ncbi:amidoligase family protein [Gimesia panareensis]|uniref:amidoligase family protein n=1 Tax=Gimesia panareensis TaxID=2527978 RepID=UPI0011899BA4|nr:amidoligase family protein [Gimesia panareensis]QDU52164.1 Putative amidoligase enzyme [Gimesia panareensis]
MSCKEVNQCKFECKLCNGKVKSEPRIRNGKEYCEDCFLEHFVTCRCCGDDFFKEEIFEIEDESYCESCVYDVSVCCEGCGSRRLNQDIYYCECHDQPFCNDCSCEESISCTIPFSKGRSDTFDINPYRNFCGIEIECLNPDLKENSFSYGDLIEHGFSQTGDGSLPGNGVEFVSNAFNGDLLFQKIGAFLKSVQEKDYYITKDCGFHIHIEISKRYYNLQKILLFYSRFQELFMEMVSSSRKDNSYAKKLHPFSTNEIVENTSTKGIKKWWYACKNDRKISRMAKSKYHDKRYEWLNLHSVFYRGTLEIRLHNGTLNEAKIKNWLLIHLTVLDFLKKLNVETVAQLPVTREFFLSLFAKPLQSYITERWEKHALVAS